MTHTDPYANVDAIRAKLSGAGEPWGYNLLDSDGQLFTWCETKDEALERLEWERTIFGRTLTLQTNYDC